VTGPEHDDDLNPEYRARAAEREANEEPIPGPMGALGGVVFAPKDHFTNPHRQGWLQRRQAKVLAEIERNRRGEYRVPTWVLSLTLVLVVAGLVALFMLV
jgi:hypothetical protein